MARGRSTHRAIAILSLCAFLAGLDPAAGLEPREEQFHYRWRLTSFLGRIAGLFFPSRGEGVLSYTVNGEGNLVSQLEITSDRSAEGEYWLYGAEIDPERGRTVAAWSSYRYKEKSKSKRSPVDEQGVVDVASGILQIRQAPPEGPQEMRIWSDGKIYPVEVVPMGDEELRLGKRKLRTRRYVVRGADHPGQPAWKGRIELWLQEGEEATPAAILIYRSGIGVLLELDVG
ncbi:MAG: DUF3108 domain-containing protein [Acidobacteria bacterium]|nr:DUF3108 domain-containing protein [Acidobacteriota bacterium]